MKKNTYQTRERVVSSYYTYSDEDIQTANDTNILDLARKRGYEVVDKSNQRWAKIKAQGGLSIDKVGNRWYCHSSGQGGGPIQLLMYMEGSSWQEAMKELCGAKGDWILHSQSKEIHFSRKDEDKSEFVLPERSRDCRNIFAYLIKTRLIHPDVVQEFVDKKLLYQNDKKSCVFVGMDKEGMPRYANIRSTNTVGAAFKGDAALSDKRFGFAKIGTNDILTLVEAPIDLLSYLSIYKFHGMYHKVANEHILSLGGVSDVALKQYLKDHPEVKTIRLGLDNDEVGNSACEAIQKDYPNYTIKRIHYNEKDMNELLKKERFLISMKREVKNFYEKVQDSSCEPIH